MRRAIGTRVRGAALTAALTSFAMAPALAQASGSGNPIAASEGQQFSGTVATFDHPVHSATISWGDGASDQFFSANGSTTVTGSHTWVEGGHYTVSVTENCAQQPCDHTSATATVSDPPLSASGDSNTATAGSSFGGTIASFTDADPQTSSDEYSVRIDWGDGATSAGTVSAAGTGYQVNGSHTYAQPGDYRVHVTVSDRGGATSSAESTLRVAPAPVHATFTSSSPSPRLGQLVAFDGSDSRPPGAVVSSYLWLVNGKEAATCDGRTSELTTRFPTRGAKTITLIATDASGNQTSASRSILVGRATDHPTTDVPTAGHDIALAAARARGKIRVIRVPAVYECESGHADTFSGAIEAAAPQALGAGCVNQVEAGIVQVDGCLTEHLDTVDVLLENIPGTPFFDEAPRQNQPLEGVPNPEAFTFESDIALQFSNNPHALCSKLPKKYQEILCPTLPGAGDEAPPSVGSGSGPCGKPPLDPCPDGVSPLGPAADRAAGATAAALAQTAALKKVSSPDVAVETPCNDALTPPKAGEAGFVHPCFRLFVSADPVVINGLTYKPAPGSVILVSPEFNLVISHSASIWLGKIKLHDFQEINYQLPATSSGGLTDFPALDVLKVDAILAQPAAQKPAESGGLASVGGFKTDGSLHVGFGDHTGTVSFHVSLPPPITDGSGGPVTASVSGTIAPDGSFQITSGQLSGANVYLGPVALKDFSACWRLHAGTDDPCPSVTGIPEQPSFGDSFWDATGELDVGSVKLIFRPPPPAGSAVTCPLTLGIGFGGGKLVFAGAALTTGPGGIEIAPGVALTDLGASFNAGDHLTTFCAYARFSVAGGLAHLVGQIFAAFVDAGYRYTFTGTELGPGMPPGSPSTNHFALGAGGELSVDLPALGDIPVGGGYILYVDDPAAIFFGANFKFSIPPGNDFGDDFTGVVIGGGLDGAIGLGHGFPFFLEGSIHVVAKIGGCVLGVCDSVDVITGDVDGIVSRGNEPGKPGGVAVCGHVDFFHVGVTGGFGYHWGDDIGDIVKHDIHTGGCDFLGEFRVNVAVARDAQASAPSTVTRVRVAPGTSAVDLYLDGIGGAPDVTITGPGVTGTTSGLADDNASLRDDVLMARSPRLKITYLTLLHPHPGVYRIVTNPGSAPVSAVRQANGVTPSVHVRVAGRGLTRTLRYDIARHPGQLVSFLERSRQTRRILGSTTGGRGRIRFDAPAGRGTRLIFAELFENGHPAEILPVARYQPSAPQGLTAARRVRVKRRATSAVISFAAVPHATSYAVRVLMRDGMRAVFITRRRTVIASGLFAEFGGRVFVRALGDGINFLDSRSASAGIPAAVVAPHRAVRRRR